MTVTTPIGLIAASNPTGKQPADLAAAPTIHALPRWTGRSSQLAAALLRVNTAIPARPPVPIMAGIVLDVDAAGELRIHAYDYETAIGTRVATVDPGTPGRVIVAGRHLRSITTSLTRAAGIKDPVITLDAVKRPGWVEVSTCGFAYSMRTMSLAEYPGTPTLDPSAAPAPSARVLGVDIAATLRFVTPAMSRDDTLPILAGVHMVATDGRFRFEATDRFRLATASVAATISPDWTAPTIIPGRVLAALVRYLGPGEWTMRRFTDRIEVTDDETTFSTLAVDGKYPAVAALWGEESPWSVTVNRAQLVAAVRFAADIAPAHHPLTLTVTPAGVVVVPSADDRDQPPPVAPPAAAVRSDTWPATREITTGFNPGFLLAALAGFPGPDVALVFHPQMFHTLAGKPMRVTAAVKDADDPDARRHLLMPVRLSDPKLPQ